MNEVITNFKGVQIFGEDPRYLEALRALPCCICEAFDLVQRSQTTAHHTICGRFSMKRTPDRQAIPLCDCHHQGQKYDRDRSKVAIHQNKRAWVGIYGPDTDYIAPTQDRILP